jgi:WD40 repeat protein
LSAVFSPDGSRIITASDDRTAKVWDSSSAKLLLNIQGHSNSVRSAAFSPDGSRIVTASDDRTAKVWDSSSAKLLLNIQDHSNSVLSAAFSPDGSRIVTASDDHTANVYPISIDAYLRQNCPSLLALGILTDYGVPADQAQEVQYVCQRWATPTPSR